jgi:membrane fusion protein, heavy metal efflux system
VDTSLTPMKRTPWVALIVVAAVALVGGMLALWRSSHRSKDAAAPAVVVPVSRTSAADPETPKVGDLVVTDEAMQLAEIKIAPAGRRLVADKLAVSGTIEAGGDRLAKITPRVAGKVVSVSAVAGDAVRAGQTLARIESTELAQAQAAYRNAASRVAVARNNLQRQRKLAELGAFGQPKVEEAQRSGIATQGEINVGESDVAAAAAEVAEARSQVGALQAVLAQAQTQVKVSESRFHRADLLLREELVSRQDWEQAEADFQRAQADVDVARANLSQGQAKIDTAQARLKAAQAKLSEARKRARIAARVVAREEAVYQGGYVTSKEIVEAEAALRQAQLDQQAAAQSVGLLGGRPGGGSIVALTSPIAGRVQERNVSIGETVDTEHPLFTVINLDQVWAQLAVTPKEMPLVRLGQRVELTADTAPGRIFTGAVSAIGTVADEKTRTVRVRCALANRDATLRPETFVQGRIVTNVRRERVVVPLEALQEHNGKPTVYVAKAGHPGAFDVRHVKLGVHADGWREVAFGLEAGEPVAVNGTFYLKSEALKSSLSDACCAVEPGK